jgi:phosphoglycolate phosphatase
VLLLFDIDGTLLLRASKSHGQALRQALREVHGVEDLPRVEVAGRTDPEIVRAMLLKLGIGADRIDARMGDVRQATIAAYARLCEPDLSDRVAPGMRALVAALAARDGVRLSLVTGNLEPVARLKLARAGLGRFFPRGQGGFGSDHEDRTELPAIARARAGRPGRPHPPERTVVIGDTPRDIVCARADGVACVAVASGDYGVDELRGADAVARDAGDLGRILDRLLGT